MFTATASLVDMLNLSALYLEKVDFYRGRSNAADTTDKQAHFRTMAERAQAAADYWKAMFDANTQDERNKLNAERSRAWREAFV